MPESFQQSQEWQQQGGSAPPAGWHTMQHMPPAQGHQAQWEQQRALHGPPGFPVQPSEFGLPQHHQPQLFAGRNAFHHGQHQAMFSFQAPQIFAASHGFHLQPQQFGPPGFQMQGGYAAADLPQPGQPVSAYLDQQRQHQQQRQQQYGMGPATVLDRTGQQAAAQSPWAQGPVPHGLGYAAGTYLEREGNASGSAMQPDQSAKGSPQKSGDAAGKRLLSILQSGAHL